MNPNYYFIRSLFSIVALLLYFITPDSIMAHCHPGHEDGTEMAPPPQYNPNLVKGEFDLVDSKTGKSVSKTTYKGKWRLVFFGFTHCTVICPTGLMTMTNILKTMGKDAEKLEAIFITVDPERDTQEIVKKYVSHFDKRIHGLVGSSSQIKSTLKNFRIEALKVEIQSDSVYQMDHPALFQLMDSEGKYVASLPSSGNVSELVAKIKTFIN